MNQIQAGERKPSTKLGHDSQDMCVGNFFYKHKGVEPRWYIFKEDHGIEVRYGAEGYVSTVVLKIPFAFRHGFESLLVRYLRELVARHGEELHNEGRKKFRMLTLTLPDQTSLEADLDIVIDFDHDSCQNQKEIANEIMATLSGVSV